MSSSATHSRPTLLPREVMLMHPGLTLMAAITSPGATCGRGSGKRLICQRAVSCVCFNS